MPQFELVLRKGGENLNTYLIGREGLVIGRASECDVVLADSMVSRRHARLWLDGQLLKVEDLGSRNGIMVNGERVARLRLDEGDELVVGTHTFQIMRATRGRSLAETGSLITYEKAGDMYRRMLKEPTAQELPVLYKASQLLGSVFDLDQLLRGILDLIFEALPVRRGFILTLEAKDAPPLIRARRPEDVPDHGLPLSKTLIQHVFHERTAIMTHDAQRDFAGSDSVVNYGIQAAMCVPLCGREEVVGAIFVDSGSEEIIFKHEHFKLLTAIGRVTGVAVENARLHETLVERERLAAIGRATAGVGHAIKNILVGIKGGAEFVDLTLDSQEVKYLKKGWPLIRRAVDRMEDLVLNLLTFSRDREPDRSPTDVNLLVNEIIDTVKPMAERVKVTVEFKKGALDLIPLDSLGVYRAIMNLVSNAIDACEENEGRVTISTRMQEGACIIEVADTGKGVPESFQPKLFEAFQSTKGARGTGLGLACARKIAREHGGDITCSTKPGKGSRFTITLPIPRPPTVEFQALKEEPPGNATT